MIENTKRNICDNWRDGNWAAHVLRASVGTRVDLAFALVYSSLDVTSGPQSRCEARREYLGTGAEIQMLSCPFWANCKCRFSVSSLVQLNRLRGVPGKRQDDFHSAFHSVDVIATLALTSTSSLSCSLSLNKAFRKKFHVLCLKNKNHCLI